MELVEILLLFLLSLDAHNHADDYSGTLVIFFLNFLNSCY